MGSDGPILDDEASSAAFLAPLLEWRDRECAIAAHLDRHARVLGISRGSGTERRIELPVRRIVGDAIGHDACALILAHTHPGGDPAPSTADVEATRALDRALRPLGIRLYDHLIFAPGGKRTSFRRLGWL